MLILPEIFNPHLRVQTCSLGDFCLNIESISGAVLYINNGRSDVWRLPPPAHETADFISLEKKNSRAVAATAERERERGTCATSFSLYKSARARLQSTTHGP